MKRLNHFTSTVALGLLGFVFLSGCSVEDIDSEDIRTSGIYAEIEITSSSSDTSTVNAKLLVGGSSSNTYVNLSGNDSLSVTINSSVSEVLNKLSESNTSKVTYIAFFNDTSAGVGDTSYKVSFDRPADTDALNSIVAMPQRVSNFVASNNSYSRNSESITLSWIAKSSSESLLLDIKGDCINEKNDVTITDSGLYVVNASSLGLGSSNSSCDITFTLTRTNTGQLDENFGEGGFITASTHSSISVSSVP